MDSSESLKPKEEVEKVESPEEVEDIKTSEESKSTKITEESEETLQKRTRRRRGAVLLILLCIGTAIFIFQRKERVTIVIPEKVTEVAPPSNTDVDSSKTEESTRPKLFVEPGVDINNRYFITVGNYNIETNASIQASKFRALNYKPEVVMLNRDGQFKVALRSYDSFEEANSDKDRLTTKHPELMSGCWVLNRKGVYIELFK